MANSKDTLISQIPSHILENYPNFFTFLEAYYEWLNEEGNPYERIKHHMEYLDFQKSLDDYVEHMKNEYLTDVPDTVLLDKELFIKWSKRFNVSRGSRYSYKFLFNILFNEDDTEIYLPKENVLRTSDGEWVSGERRIVITNSGSPDLFNFQILSQEREVAPDVFEYAFANIQTARQRYSGRYRVLELSITDFNGEFDPAYPVYTEAGASEWIIPTVDDVDVSTAGTGYSEGSRIELNAIGPYEIIRESETDGEFDLRITSYFQETDMVVEVNGTSTSNFTTDGTMLFSGDISKNDTVRVELPSYPGYIVVDRVDQNGGVAEVNMIEVPIGISSDYAVTINSISGSGFDGDAKAGVTAFTPGAYVDNRGHLSSTMYLQDSFYYQEYSYVIKTRQDISKYSETVQDLLHPAGFEMFGMINIINVIEALLSLKESSNNIIANPYDVRPRYSLGPNYSFFDRFKAGLSERLYRMYHFRNEVEQSDGVYVLGNYAYDVDNYVQSYDSINWLFDMEMAVGEDTNYNLEDKSFEKTYTNDGYYEDGMYEEDYFRRVGKYSVTLKGWMTKHYFSDYHLYIPQDYSAEDESANQYFETGYLSERV